MGVIPEMSLLLLGLLLVHQVLSNGGSSKRSGLEDAVKNDPTEMMVKNENGIEDKFEELMQRGERMDISWKMEKANLERKLEVKTLEVENLNKRVKEGELQFESRLKEVMLNTQKEVASLKSEMTMQSHSLKSDGEARCKAEVKKELDKVLPTAVEQGLRDLPFEMVCAYQSKWDKVGVISYDRISVEFNNSDLPGGGDGTMNIETGAFTTVTSGYYIVTFSAYAGEYTHMSLYHNGARVEESRFVTDMGVGSGSDYIFDQGSRTVILHLLAGDTLDLRTTFNEYYVEMITLCFYMAPAPYGL